MRKFMLLAMFIATAALSCAAEVPLPLDLVDAYVVNMSPRQTAESDRYGLDLDPSGIYTCLDTTGAHMANHPYPELKAISGNALVSSPADPPSESELATFHIRDVDMIELTESMILVGALAIVSASIWRERRVLRRRQLMMRVLVPALPAVGLLSASVYMHIMYADSIHHEVSTLGQLLEPIALGVLLTLIYVSWMRFERPARQKTVLAIGAHPDDIEFGCGGTMLRLRKEGAATYGLVLSIGERGHDRTGESTPRVEEARAAARVMALCDIEIHDFPDTLLHEHKVEIRSVIEAALARWRPDVIFTHNGHDVHTDHRTIFDATREAARGAYTILCYENPNTPPGFQPGYFFDVSNDLEGKIAALACHRTQTGKPYAASSIVRAIAGFRGTQARVPLAEGFEVMRVLEKAREP